MCGVLGPGLSWSVRRLPARCDMPIVLVGVVGGCLWLAIVETEAQRGLGALPRCSVGG